MSARATEPPTPAGGVPVGLAGRSVGEAMLRTPKVVAAADRVADLLAFFEDEHVHAAPVVDHLGRVVSLVERGDLAGCTATDPAASAGQLLGRTVTPGADLTETWHAMRASGRRRLAVVDADTGVLQGLLCLKRSGSGFCADADVAARRQARAQERS